MIQGCVWGAYFSYSISPACVGCSRSIHYAVFFFLLPSPYLTYTLAAFPSVLWFEFQMSPSFVKDGVFFLFFFFLFLMILKRWNTDFTLPYSSRIGLFWYTIYLISFLISFQLLWLLWLRLLWLTYPACSINVGIFMLCLLSLQAVF